MDTKIKPGYTAPAAKADYIAIAQAVSEHNDAAQPGQETRPWDVHHHIVFILEAAAHAEHDMPALLHIRLEIPGRGLADKLRDVVHFLCANVVEMTPNREHNFCCSAGGGIINCGPPFKSVRMEGNRVKADQLRNTGVHTVVAPCHNCHGGLEDIIKHYKLGMHTKFIGDLIYELMEKPEV